MCSLASKKHPINTSSKLNNNKEVDQDEQEDDNYNPGGHVSSHLCLIKPAHTNGTLDKAVVLRRIRHRKRVNKVKSAVQALLGSPFAGAGAGAGNGDDNKKTSNNSVPQLRWADDAFAAP